MARSRKCENGRPTKIGYILKHIHSGSENKVVGLVWECFGDVGASTTKRNCVSSAETDWYFEHLFVIDQANLDWIESKKRGGGNMTEHEIIDDLFQLIFVDIKNRAWHAGNSYWKGTKDLNSSSIGIEIDNSGPHILNENFTNIQINSLCKLIKKLSTKYNIESKNILGHSDIAPYRKIDPGEKFPWISLHKKKLCYLPNISKKKIVLEKSSKSLQYYKKKEYLEILRKLGFIGYDIRGVQLKDRKFQLLLQAYQRHYRQSDISGNADNQTIRLINTHYKDMLT